MVYTPTGSLAYVREMSTPPTLLRSMALLYLLPSYRFIVTSAALEVVIIFGIVSQARLVASCKEDGAVSGAD